MRSHHLVISGNIGAGKTTLTQLLAKRHRMKFHLEEVADNPFLSRFYKDMPRWALGLQLFFVTERVQVQKAIEKQKKAGEGCLQDRCLEEDAEIFAFLLEKSGTFDTEEFKAYRKVFALLSEGLSPPDLLIYWRKSLPVLLKNIRQRDRSYERDIDPTYLSALNERYDAWFEGYRGKKLKFESDTLDCLNNPRDLDAVSQEIEAMLHSP